MTPLPIRLAWLTTAHIGNYHRAMIAAARAHFATFDVWRYALPGAGGQPGAADHVSPDSEGIHDLTSYGALRSIMQQSPPDILLISGYNGLFFAYAALLARFKRIPAILLADTWSDKQIRVWYKEAVKSLYVRGMYDALVVPGSRGKDYYHKLRFPAARIYQPMYTIPVDTFAQPVTLNDSSLRWPSRAFITVSRLSAEKNIPRVLQAFSEYRRQGGQWDLVIVGDGPERARLLEAVPDAVRPALHLPGWLPYDSLPAVYQASHCFILASLSESWGQVVVEAAAAGLPLLLSKQVGCAPELCHEGQNGYWFDPTDVGQLTGHLWRMERMSEAARAALGRYSQGLAQGYDTSAWVRTLTRLAQELGIG
jgi:1,2-diacylglycerol 3-alpha-glucosyltransferase